ncbi:periplasmic chaperone for outer membrane proteins Skp [Salinisphaera sp. C84B14]|uniref:OmpH family outer membrane protein n=1 Tax=Salinisphaera sp. C84B14 TaxID=1304155 RepID=UPI0032B2A29A
MYSIRRIPLALALTFMLAFTGALQAAPAASDGANKVLRIGVVDVSRVVNESPQAARAKSSMATQFAKRKNALEAKANALRQDMDRLAQDGSVMSDEDRDRLQSDIRDRQRELQLERSKYNDDVSDAEQKEFEQMRGDILDIINQYAEDNGYDLILGEGVIYSSDAVDVTDEILAELGDG